MTPPPNEAGGILNAIFGSFVMVLLATFVGTPIGIMAGIYLAEYNPKGMLSSVTRFVNDILLSAPSIVIGLFVYAVVVAYFKQFSGLAGALSLALIVIPVVIRTTENMLQLVPPGLREAAYALGTPKWKVILSITLRAARRRRDRRAAGRGPHRRRDRAAAVHRAQQPVLDRRRDPADGQPAGDHLQVRDEPVRELAAAGLGRRVPDHHRGARPQHPGAGPDAHQALKPGRLPPQPAQNEQEKRNMAPITAPTVASPAKISVKNLNFYYGKFHALKGINLEIPENKVTAFIGPSGCGKSTLLRTFNRMFELYPEQRAEGAIELDGENLLTSKQDVALIRAKVGMVFQKPTPFPMSIYDNIAFGVKLFENLSASEMDDRVEWALKKAALWTEVRDKLQQSGSGLSGGQQQRLCIARGIAIKPEVLLLDEPCSALDPISTAKIEELIAELKNEYTVVIVTHNMQQAARCSDYTAYMYLGDLIEFGATEQMFFKPQRKETEDYITGRFG